MTKENLWKNYTDEQKKVIFDFAEDYKKWDGGLILSSSHETERLLRMNRPFVSCHITRPVYDEMAVSDLPLCGIRGAEYLYEKIWNAKLSGHIRMAKT